MAPQDSSTLTTLTLTRRERAVIARALTVTATIVDAIGDVDDARTLMNLWERVQPDGDIA